MKRRRQRLGDLEITPPKLEPYGRGRLGEARVATCAPPISPGRRVQVCVTRPGKPSRQMHDARDACTILREAVDADREGLYALHLDNRNRLIGIEEVAKGSIGEVGTTPREVFKSAMLTNASAIILAHNHPSGYPTPSQDDFDITERMASVGQLVGIPIRDHIIVSAEGCTSIREMRPTMQFGGRRRRRRKAK